jgi:ribonuclease/clavin/mitogillin
MSSAVRCVPGLNPGPFTLDGTNTWLVGTGPSKILIDTGAGVEEYEATFLQALKETNTLDIPIVLITHGHADHISGIKQIQRHFNPIIYCNDDQITAHRIRNQDIFQVQGATLEAIQTPGHTQDSISFLFREEHSIFSGDCVLGRGSTVFNCLADFMQSLQRLLDMKPKRIYPGHGPIVENAVVKLEEYVRHRKERETQILFLLQKQSMDLDSIVKNIYVGYHESVRIAATESTRLHCIKLQDEGKIKLQNSIYAFIEQ